MPSATEVDKLTYLKSIKSVRETNACTKDLILQNKLTNFDVDLSKLDDVVDFVAETILSGYPTKESFQTIPVHGRYQHFEGNNRPRLTNLIENEFSELSDLEKCKKVVDLFIVSVLLDAGAGNQWAFEEDGLKIGRSEGIAVASFHMFINGQLSSDSENDKYVVNGEKLLSLSTDEWTKAFQISESNPMAGLDGRIQLMRKLGSALTTNKEIFGEDGRPGNIVDFLIKKSTVTEEGYSVELEDLWMALMDGLSPVWPEEGRIKVYGKVIGDAWILQNKVNDSIKKFETEDIPEWSRVVTFHKLTQWLTYSLFLPLQKFAGFKILNANYMTGLPEYRNGGLFVDLSLLSLKPEQLEKGLSFSKKVGFNPDIPTFVPADDVIVEWRSCTICLLDYLLPLINKKLEVAGTEYELALPQLIEAGSWSSGRRIAKKLRANGGPPIELFADGTVF
ncbi:hypothetical protein CANARDRAFT_9356 [[Candida] arabinofermentans NRRL YB-2248]|uniref:Uracil catabolism protein 4 n=1 Tax=[Candida] arabinofermentans NRRL YB-2248 TaxID=983967 RepID=A0A1E4SWA3_9ASCO|nr:hypothetical protein CANARDRAFT_9356 [[Candida] arabinofermentans NRRL YB-2248]